MNIPKQTTHSKGFSMVEVLASIVVLSFGLLGFAGLHTHMQSAETESYQRAQALMLVQDMVDRVNTNRKNASNYVTASPRGTGNAIQDCTGLTGHQLDLCEWNNALLGAAETIGGQSVGAVVGARGCITEPVATMPRQITVTVAWQGLTDTIAPAGSTCGQNLYGSETKRRVVTAQITIGCLQNDLTTGLCVTP